MKKIEKTLLFNIFSCDSENKHNVIIFFNDYKKVYDLLKKKNIESKYFKFINGIGARMNINQIISLSKENVVEYITSASNVEALMDKARETININALHSQNILGQNRTLAIIDTGISPHIDFLSYTNRIIFFKDFVNDREGFYDDNGHGTFISGVAVGNGYASGGKYQGIAPKANLVMLKALDKNGEANAFNILSGMEWIYDNFKEYNIDAVCMSFGSNPLDKDDPLVIGANALVKSGITVICAGGNSGPEPRTIKSPGVSNKVITVGGVNDREEDLIVPEFSSRGPAYSFFKPDILAPAVDIISTNYRDLEEVPYTTMSGTSVATPIVAGTVILLKQLKPDLTPIRIKNIITSNTLLLPSAIGGGRNKQGYGMLKIKKTF